MMTAESRLNTRLGNLTRGNIRLISVMSLAVDPVDGPMVDHVYFTVLGCGDF